MSIPGMKMTATAHIWILIGPCLALLYEVTVVIFLASFGEISWNTKEFLFNNTSLYLRLALLVAFLSLSIDRDNHNQQHQQFIFDFQFTVLLISSLISSFYLIRQTRRVVAGPKPPFELENDNNNNNNDESDDLSMTNKIVLITGANTGIGKETARQLAARGATVILACRDERKAKQAILDIVQSNTNSSKSQQQRRQQSNGRANLFFLQLDLSSFESVRKAAETFVTMDLRNDTTNNNSNYNYNTAATTNKLDVLINNAGVMFSEKQMSQDGFEMCLQANHLGHFLFTLLLLPHMNHPNPRSKARILNLTSITYKMATANGGEFNFHDYNCNDRPYTLFTTYSQSKLANILFTKELARRYPDTITSLAINPGIVRTDVTRNMSSFLQYGNYLFGFLVRWYQKNPAEGAYSSVWAATTPGTTGLTNGSFISNSRPEPTLEYCQNEAAAKKLWEWSEQMVQWKSK
jgi:NAD(P)-dependent dehydrogenase (short-subunit alcohol dehydrogenase family)